MIELCAECKLPMKGIEEVHWDKAFCSRRCRLDYLTGWLE